MPGELLPVPGVRVLSASVTVRAVRRTGDGSKRINMKREWIQRGAGWAAVLCVTLLTGCTSYVTTQVTAFSDWSGSDATRTYAFTRTEAQKNSIEQSTYEPIVANELSTYAFRQVPQAQARYLVGLTYAVGSDLVTVPQPVYYDPWFAPGPYWRRGPWGRGVPGADAGRLRRADVPGVRLHARYPHHRARDGQGGVQRVRAHDRRQRHAAVRDAVPRAQCARRLPAVQRRGSLGPAAGRQARRPGGAGRQRTRGAGRARVGAAVAK